MGEKLRKLRIKRNWSQGELSRRSGIHRTYISGIEKGLRNPALKNINRLAKALNISPSEVFN
ncbi:MAG: XRE family transcriptional regulator [Candidatus Harrisonbacteria bacterium CG10_big_fil_rev_8_21_14_0_10_49_15]|uniref:XRE family transcriptional regulator n=1 Tax=Candidatus Harrisonbacteria bacterium CG10_big_fil_rev_8_21_14_0_10_49_15 TaxID=1974587 RepID=A0A2H0UJQ9_9BACT|nr:MAG: XRE family transcriptional regulator [Candidatus Harrisonbacteria bacterium CG10_big_fil_rev_8_21_14_0_10_49_15]